VEVADCHSDSGGQIQGPADEVRHSSLKGHERHTNASPCRLAVIVPIVMLSGCVPCTLSILGGLSKLVRIMCIRCGPKMNDPDILRGSVQCIALELLCCLMDCLQFECALRLTMENSGNTIQPLRCLRSSSKKDRVYEVAPKQASSTNQRK
jgi:hypothetical protein